jgi:hypothetical protein
VQTGVGQPLMQRKTSYFDLHLYHSYLSAFFVSAGVPNGEFPEILIAKCRSRFYCTWFLHLMKDEKFQILKLGTFQPLSVVFVSETIRDIEIWDEWTQYYFCKATTNGYLVHESPINRVWRTDNTMAKRNSNKTTTDDLQNITNKTKDRVTRTLLKTGCELRCSMTTFSFCKNDALTFDERWEISNFEIRHFSTPFSCVCFGNH